MLPPPRATKRRRSLRLIGKEMTEPCYKTPKKPSLECNEQPEDIKQTDGGEKEDVSILSSVPPGIIDIDIGVSLNTILGFALLKCLLRLYFNDLFNFRYNRVRKT